MSVPQILVEVPDTIESVVRPVVLDVARHVFSETAIDETKVRIYYPGDVEKSSQWNSTLTKQSPDTPSKFPFAEQVTLEVDEGYEAERLLSTAVFRPENLFIFRDDRIQTGIKPMYSSTDMTLNFKYRASSQTQALRWRDRIRDRVSLNREQFLHTVKYHYLIPPEMIVILQEIWKMREAVAPYGETWEQFFSANTTQRCHYLTNMAGQQGQWGVADAQTRIVGWFDFEGVPERGSKEDEADTWTISFAYKFKYDKPIACAMYYPLMIHNQLIKYRPDPNDQPMDRPEKHLLSFSESARQLYHFEAGRPMIAYQQTLGISIPNFDEFLPSSIVKGTKRLITLLNIIDPTQLRMLLNIGTDFGGDFTLDSDVLAFLTSEAQWICQPYQSLFNVSLYQNADLMDPSCIQSDSNLNLTTTFDMDLRQYYHVRLGIVTDLSLLSPDAIKRMRQNGCAAIKILDAMFPGASRICPLPTTLSNTCYMPTSELDKWLSCLGKNGLREGSPFYTVETLIVQVQRNEALTEYVNARI